MANLVQIAISEVFLPDIRCHHWQQRCCLWEGGGEENIVIHVLLTALRKSNEGEKNLVL